MWNLLFLFHDELVHHIAVHTGEAAFLQLLLQHADHGHIQLAIHQKDIVAFRLGCLNIAVLLVAIIGIEVNQCAVLIRLGILDKGLVLLESIVFLEKSSCVNIP